MPPQFENQFNPVNIGPKQKFPKWIKYILIILVIFFILSVIVFSYIIEDRKIQQKMDTEESRAQLGLPIK
jgi:uncharacterized membrane protein YdbT with pleckstrin-like domain